MTERQRRDSIASFVLSAYEALEEVDYYRVLGISSAATASDIRAAYYRLAQSLHPDVHGDDADADFRLKLTAVFSRVVEAYKALSDPQKRSWYDETLASGDFRLRGTRPRSRTMDQQIHQPSARRFFQLGMTALSDQNARSAVQNFKLALSMEPDNPLIQNKLAEAQALQKR